MTASSGAASTSSSFPSLCFPHRARELLRQGRWRWRRRRAPKRCGDELPGDTEVGDAEQSAGTRTRSTTQSGRQRRGQRCGGREGMVSRRHTLHSAGFRRSLHRAWSHASKESRCLVWERAAQEGRGPARHVCDIPSWRKEVTLHVGACERPKRRR